MERRLISLNAPEDGPIRRCCPWNPPLALEALISYPVEGVDLPLPLLCPQRSKTHLAHHFSCGLSPARICSKKSPRCFATVILSQ